MSNQTYFQKCVRMYGFDATVRMARNLGVDFIDCYVMAFGKMPKII